MTAGLDPHKEIPTQTLFAPEQFKNWSDEVRLSAKPFENYDAGIRFNGEYVIPIDALEERSVAYETVLRESREYRDQLPPNSPLKVAIRTTCVRILTTNEMRFLKDWSLLGAHSYFKPLREVIDKSSPGYVKIREPRYGVVGDETYNGSLSPIDGEGHQNLSFAEALEASDSILDETVVILHSDDLSSG